jgi:hypothetical protein
MSANRLWQWEMSQQQNHSVPATGTIVPQNYGNWAIRQSMMRQGRGTGLPGGYAIANPYKNAPLAPGGK